MSWFRVLAPMAGTERDGPVLAAAAALARPFDAEVAAVFAPPDAADLMPWMGEGFLGGVHTAAVESLREGAEEGAAVCRGAFDALDHPSKSFAVLPSPVWAALSAEARLADVVTFDGESARARGPLAEVFRQTLMDEGRPVYVSRAGTERLSTVALAWDAGKESTRAARAAVPLLQKAQRVVVLCVPDAAPRPIEPRRLVDHLAAKGVASEALVLGGRGEPSPILTAAAEEIGADLLVAGAFGHPRLQEFVFGGTTRALLHGDGPSLFLSH